MPISIQSGRFQWKEYELAYELWGTSGTPCLLMHGILLDSQMNRSLARRFVQLGYQVVLLDLLGHGDSDKPLDPREHRIDFYGDQALACLDHLGFEKAVMGGVSLGAIATLDANSKAPERIMAMYLEMPVMEWSTPFAGMLLIPMLSAVKYLREVYRPFAKQLRKVKRPRRKDLLTSIMNGLSAEPEEISAVLHGVLAGPLVPPAKLRREMQQPALVIGHGLDRLHSMRDAVALSRELKNAKLLKANSPGFELRSEDAHIWPEVKRFMQLVQDTDSLLNEDMSEMGIARRKAASRSSVQDQASSIPVANI